MARPLQTILEMQFELVYYTNMTLRDVEECEVKELNWFYGKLVERKKKENEITKGKIHG